VRLRPGGLRGDHAARGLRSCHPPDALLADWPAHPLRWRSSTKARQGFPPALSPVLEEAEFDRWVARSGRIALRPRSQHVADGARRRLATSTPSRPGPCCAPSPIPADIASQPEVAWVTPIAAFDWSWARSSAWSSTHAIGEREGRADLLFIASNLGLSGIASLEPSPDNAHHGPPGEAAKSLLWRPSARTRRSAPRERAGPPDRIEGAALASRARPDVRLPRFRRGLQLSSMRRLLRAGLAPVRVANQRTLRRDLAAARRSPAIATGARPRLLSGVWRHICDVWADQGARRRVAGPGRGHGRGAPGVPLSTGCGIDARGSRADRRHDGRADCVPDPRDLRPGHRCPATS
jgi:hypothetical protein